MTTEKQKSLNRKLVPYILFPIIIGILTGALIFLFKITSSSIIHLSEELYEAVRQNPVFLPLLILGGAAVGAIAALILKYAKECRGGGIPTAIASIRGLIHLKWIQGIFVLFGTALLTYLTGVPLGNEGPSVQMGAAVGEVSSNISGKKKSAYERYFMTGGACSGFAIATGAPLAGIMFAFEEAHKRFSATLFAVASISVLFGTVTQRYLCFFFDVDTTFFDFTVSQILPMRYLWAAIIIGAICGICSLIFTRSYKIIKKLSRTKAKKLPFSAKIIIIFTVTAALGFVSASFVGTGHSLIEALLHGKTVWYSILIAFFVRAILMICANNEGVCGGIFVPNLAFGAMIASLISDGLIALGLVEPQYYTILIVVGMASFLAAASRTPITAIIFAAEALCIVNNILPVIFGVAVSYIIVEASGKMSFTDTVIESRAERARHGKPLFIVESRMIVKKGSFADDMEIRDIIWPPSCTILSIDRDSAHSLNHNSHKVYEGDMIHIHCQTNDPEQTIKTLESILGEDQDRVYVQITPCGEDHLVPME